MAKYDAEHVRLNRNYIAQLTVLGEIKPRKSAYDLSPDYVVRVGDNLRAQERAGLPPDLGAARAHKPAADHPSPAAYKAAQRIENISFEQQGGVWVGRITGEDAADHLYRLPDDAIVSIAYEGKDGQWHNIYQHGARVDTMGGYIDDYDGDFVDWLAAAADEIYGDDYAGGYSGGAYAIVSVFH